jgi:glycosyltransferase involved in cell wall biosynthesis
MARHDRLDVLHLIGSLTSGGAERNLYYLAPEMARSRFSYGICCLLDRGELADEVESLGLPVSSLGYRKCLAGLAVFRLWRLLKRRRVKIIHTHLFECGVVGRLAAWLAGVPVIVTHEHGKTLWKRWHHRWFERLAARRTDLRIAVSEDIRDLRLKHEHTPPEKIVVVANAVEPSRFEVPEAARDAKRAEIGVTGSVVVGTVGRLVEAKSYDMLLEIARDVSARRPDVKFILVGEGHLGGTLRRMRDTLGLADRVLFLGNRRDIPELLAAMDLYVITSQREGLPVSLIEAMMAAKPVVATAVGGIPENIVDGEDGVLVEPANRQAFVEAALSLLGDPRRMRELGRRARDKAVARYSACKILETLETIYVSLLVSKGMVPSTSLGQPNRR